MLRFDWCCHYSGSVHKFSMLLWPDPYTASAAQYVIKWAAYKGRQRQTSCLSYVHWKCWYLKYIVIHTNLRWYRTALILVIPTIVFFSVLSCSKPYSQVISLFVVYLSLPSSLYRGWDSHITENTLAWHLKTMTKIRDSENVDIHMMKTLSTGTQGQQRQKNTQREQHCEEHSNNSCVRVLVRVCVCVRVCVRFLVHVHQCLLFPLTKLCAVCISCTATCLYMPARKFAYLAWWGSINS